MAGSYRAAHQSQRRLAHARMVAFAAVLALAAALWGGMALVHGQPAEAATVASGLHESGNHLVDGSGHVVVLRGVNRSGTEYQCIHNNGIFDGPSDDASIAAMASWHINTVRVPLNEDCWLGINGAPAAYSGANYQNAIESYVSRLHAAGLIAVLDLHWTAAGSAQSTNQQDMPDADHAPAFWSSVATAFKADSSTLFDLFNEPHDVSWTCWRDGGDCGIGYQVAGMTSLLTAVRNTGATNPVMLGGLAYANDLSSWLTYRPKDPANDLVASWHSYNFNACNTQSCWDNQIAPVAAQVPLVTGETGENDCTHGYLDGLLPWLDSHGAGYLGWGWNTADCGSFPALISNYDGTPTAFGIGLRDHLASLASTPTQPSTSPAPSSSSNAPACTPSTTTSTTPATPISAAPTTTTSPAPTTSAGSSGAIATSTSSDTSNAPYYWEDDLTLKPNAAVTQLTVAVTVPHTNGISYAGAYTTAPKGAMTTTSTTDANNVTYQATLNSGQSIAAGYALKIGDQYNGSGTAHATSTDTYKIVATVGGANYTASGHF